MRAIGRRDKNLFCCPFCGKPGAVLSETPNQFARVFCANCLAGGPYKEGQTAKEAVLKWNSRRLGKRFFGDIDYTNLKVGSKIMGMIKAIIRL